MNNSTRRSDLGSVREVRPGKWQARIFKGTKANGKRRNVSRTFSSAGEAREWLIKKSLELGGCETELMGITLRQVWMAYKGDRKGKLANKTLAAYTWLMEGAQKDKSKSKVSSWLDEMGDVDVSTITPAMVQRRLDGMPYQKAKHAKNALSSVLTWAARSGIMASNPLRGHVFEYGSKADEPDFDDDPFAAIEETRNVWGRDTVLKCYRKIRGLALEPAWLVCVGAGLRVEEALALRKMDVRRVKVGERDVAMEQPNGEIVMGKEPIMVTQLAVHAARTDLDKRKTTKTAQSRRIVAMLEPLGERYWEIASGIGKRDELVCKHSATRQNKTWRLYFKKPPDEWHKRMSDDRKAQGKLYGLPYIPLSKMRNTHVTIMAESGISDAMNANMHGHTEMVERRNYLRPDTTMATVSVSETFASAT